MSYESSHIDVRGVRLHVRRAGVGRPLLYLHGGGGVSEWLPVFDRLARDHTLVVPDHPGFGQSDEAPHLRDVPDYAMFYLDALESLVPSSRGLMHLVGHSIGGWIAAELATRDCSRLHSLSLIAPAGLRVKGVPMGDPFIWGPEEGVRNQFVDQTLADRLLAQMPASDEMDRIIKNRYTFAKLAWQPRLFDPRLEKWLHRVTVPAQLVWGDSDRLIPVAYAARWQAALPNARVDLVADSGHLPHVERPEPTGDALIRFLAQCVAESDA